MRLILTLVLSLIGVPAALAADGYVVHATEVVDRKAVIATVEPVHQLVARARIGGTIASLTVKEGDTVAAGAQIALVADEKLALQMQALDARIASQQSQRDQAKTDHDRIAELARRGVSTQTQLDQAKTNLDVAERNLAAMRSDRDVIAQQASEGAVLAPGAGRVLSVPVSAGRVVLPGETIATLAEDQYILRLELPERHARFLRAGDTVRIGSRGLQDEGEGNAREQGASASSIRKFTGGRVIADVEVGGLGDYFVGERTRVYIDAGARRTIIVPASYVYRRAGVNYVRLAGTATKWSCSPARPATRRWPGRRDPRGPARRRQVWLRHEARTFRRPHPDVHRFAADAASAHRRRWSPARSPSPRCRARRSRRSACRWSTSSSPPTATRRTKPSNSSPVRSKTSSRASTGSSMSIRRRRTIASSSPRGSWSGPTRIRRCCSVHEKIRANIGDLPKGIPEPLIVGRGINDVAILVLTLSAERTKPANGPPTACSRSPRSCNTN